MMEKLNKEVTTGLLFLATGTGFAAYAALGFPVGTAFRMGPGFFPLIVGSLLAVLGMIGVVRGVAAAPSSIGPVPWRGIILISLSMIGFGLMVRPLGMVPALFVMSIVAAYGSRKMTVTYALVMAVVMTAFCTFLFGYVLNLSVPLVGDLLKP